MAKIGLYYPWIYLKGGVERTIIGLCKRSRHQLTVFTNRYEPRNTFPELERVRPILLKPVSVKRQFLPLTQAFWRIATQKIDLTDFKALIVFSADFGDLITLRNHEKPLICLCFTPLKIIHDPYMRIRLLNEKKINPALFRSLQAGFIGIERRAWRRYAKVISISREVKSRILKANLVPEEKIQIAYPGIDPNLLSPTWNFKPYFLLPGRIMWEKNIELAVSAFKSLINLKDDYKDFKLIIAGMVDDKSVEYYRKIEELICDYRQHIKIIVSPSDEELRELYQDCYAVLFTALNEDFGIVPLEGMAFGKPVIAVNRGGPTETIIPGQTGFLVEPTDMAFTESMKKLVDNPELVKKMGKKARDHSYDFTMDKFVSQIDNIIDMTIEKNH